MGSFANQLTMKDSCHSFLSSRECALLRSKFSSPSTKFTEVTIRGRGPHLPPKKNSQYSDVARLLEHLEYFFGCFLETVDSVGHIPDSCKLFNFKCLIYMRKLRIKKIIMIFCDSRICFSWRIYVYNFVITAFV